MRRILKAAPLVMMFLLLNTRKAHAVCSFSPTPDPTADGSANSLRHAIIAANANGQNCTIQLQAGTYTLTIANTNGQENHAAQGDLDITDSSHTVTIQGKGAGVSIVTATDRHGHSIDDRVFQVLGGVNAAFKNLTIEGGIAHDNGSAGVLPGTTASEGGGLLIQDGGHVTLSQVWLQGNRAMGGAGTNGVCVISHVSLQAGGPGEAGAGGGLFLASGAVNLISSRISGNTAIGGNGGHSVLARSIPACHLTPIAGGNGGSGGGGAGGGLYVVSGNLAMSTTTLAGNSAAGGAGGTGSCPTCSGGGLVSSGSGGGAQGGGLFTETGAVSVRSTTVSGNSAAGGAGGLNIASEHIVCDGNGGTALGAGLFVNGADISLANSTVFGNQANGGSGEICTGIATHTSAPGGDALGGGLYLNAGDISLTGDTIASNRALIGFEKSKLGSSSGGGIANTGANSFLTNTTLIGNNAQDSGTANNGDDVSGPITATYSLISQKAGATITDDGGNIFNVNPMLDPGGLRSNGGPTQTVALVQGSPADGTGDNPICKDAPPTGLGGIDQRGFARFRPGDNLCDIGAFEFITLLVQPTALSFGFEPVGHQTPSQTISITNNQTTTVTLSKSIGGANPADFIVSTTCGGHLPTRASCSILVAFHPTATGARSAVLTLSDSPDRTSPYHVTLTGVSR
ncbi:MAG: choice-of-anchor D domain-containing protein [Deltaproteobacteria bacterium]|nr:choice-of-anchor D domain-containing protein [Deltaproteobacteria bacterium]